VALPEQDDPLKPKKTCSTCALTATCVPYNAAPVTSFMPMPCGGGWWKAKNLARAKGRYALFGHLNPNATPLEPKAGSPEAAKTLKDLGLL
jgi:hypothetical protein